MKEYTREILSLYTTPSVDGLSNVVKRVTWRYQVKEDTQVADLYKETYFDNVNPNDFIDYGNLSQEIIFSWIDLVEDIESLTSILDEKLLSVKSPEIIESEIPWDRSINYTGTEQFIIIQDDTILLEPSRWNSMMFNTIIKQQGSSIILPTDILAYKQGIVPIESPLIVSDTLKIYQVGNISNTTGFDDNIIENANIAWDFSSGKAVGIYEPTDKDIDNIKDYLKSIVRNKNSILEETPIQVDIDGTTFSVYATTWGRLFIITKIMRLSDGESCDWYSNNIKTTVTKEQLMTMLMAVDNYIDSLWDNKIPKILEINSCSTVDQLKQIEV